MPSTNPAVTNPAPTAIKHPTIKAGGARGFLLWMKSDPLMSKVYARIKPQLSQLAASGQLGGFGDDSMGLDTIDLSSADATPDMSNISDAITAAAPTTAGGSSDWLNTITGLIGAAGQAVMTGENIATANKVTNLQLQQAAAGKPPLNLSSYGLSTTPGFNLGLSSSTEKTVLMGAGILGGVLLLMSFMKHRR